MRHEMHDQLLINRKQELFMEIKNWWMANCKDILMDSKNKHLRREVYGN